MILDQKDILERIREVALKNRIDVPPSDGMTTREVIETIRAALNGLFFSDVEMSMLPNWAYKRIWDGSRRTPVPQLFANDTYHNWIPIGSPGCMNFAMSDAHGLTCALESCGSIEFWPRNSEIVYPSLLSPAESLFRLLSIEDQIYEWAATIGPIAFQRLVYHVTIGAQEFLVNEINLQNLALEPEEFTFYVALRPFHVSGIVPIGRLAYDSSTLCLYSNEYLAIKLDRQPSSLVMSTFDDPNLSTMINEIGRIDQTYATARGVGTAIARYDIKLRPAGKEKLVFVSPLIHMTKNEPLPESSSSYGNRNMSVTVWFDFTDASPFGEYPDEVIGMAAASASVSMIVRIRRLISTLTPQDLVKRTGEISRIILAIAQSGHWSIAHHALSEFVSKFTTQTEIMSHALTLTPMLFTINRIKALWSHNKLDDTIEQFKKTMDSEIEKVIREYGAENKQSPLGPLISNSDQDIPSIESIEQRANDPPTLHLEKKVALEDVHEWYWVYLSGIAIRNTDDIFSDSLVRYAERIRAACKAVLRMKPYDYESVDDLEVILGFISACTLSKHYDVTAGLFEALVSGMREKRFFKGLVRYPGKNGRISSHHALRIAHAFVLLGARHEAELILSKIPDYLSEFHYLPEWIDPKTRGGTGGSGCSISAAADLKLLLRDMLLYERGSDLHVFSGIPEDWFTSERPLAVLKIPTSIGMVSLFTGVSANQHQIEIKMDRLPEEMEVSLPSHIPLHMVKVFGGTVIGRFETPTNRVRLIPLTEQVAITFHR